jgi:hypothetical protein
VKLKALITLVLFALLQSTTFAQDDYYSYDEIIKSLDKGRVTTKAPPRESSFEKIKMHASVGMIGSYITVAPKAGKLMTGVLNGFDATFGIDLFDPSWVTEFGMRSFNETKMNDKSTSLALREFDLKVVYQPEVTKYLRVRVGGGLAARYLTYDNSSDNSGRQKYTTPASLIKAGFIARLTDMLSLGVDLSYRSRLIYDNIDQNALDSTIRADISF